MTSRSDLTAQFRHIENRLLTHQAMKAEGFVGRETEIETLVKDVLRSEKRFVVIEGEPGAGKSALAAVLPGHFVGPSTLIRYAFSLEFPDINDLGSFSEYICGRLSREYGVRARSDASAPWHARLSHALTGAAYSLSSPDARRIYILIDGIEECPNFQELLPVLPRDNKIVYLLLTQPGVINPIDRMNCEKRPLRPLAIETARHILKRRLGNLWTSANDLVEDLLRHEQNLNPLVLTEFAEEFENHPGSARDLWNGIQGLQSYFRKRCELFDPITREILGALSCVVGDNLSNSALAAFTGEEQVKFRNSMNAATRFVKYASGGYQFRHNAWKTYSRKEFNQTAKRFASWTGRNARTNAVDDGGYSLRHGARHLIDEKEWEEAAELLSDFEFLMRRVDPNAMRGLLNEFEAVRPHSQTPEFIHWWGLFREKGHLLSRGTERWGADRILFQLAWEDGEDSAASAAAKKFLQQGKATWEKILAQPPTRKYRRNHIAIPGCPPVIRLRDGNLLTGADDCDLRIWNSATGDSIYALSAGFAGSISVLELNDGSILAWEGGEHPSVGIWNPTTDQWTPVLTGIPGCVLDAREREDGRVFLRIFNQSTRTFDLSGNVVDDAHWDAMRPIRTINLGSERQLSWSGAVLYLRNHKSSPRGIELLGHQDEVNGAIALRDGRLLSWSKDMTLRIWTSSGEFAANLAGHADIVMDAMELQDGRLLSWDSRHVVRIWSAKGEFQRELKVTNNPHGQFGVLEIGRGRIASWSNAFSGVRIWNLSAGECEVILGENDGNGVDGVLSLKGNRILNWSWTSRKMSIYDAPDRCTTNLGASRHEWDGGIKLSDGRLLARFDRTLRILSNSEGIQDLDLDGDSDPDVNLLELKDKRILAHFGNHAIRIWNSSNGKIEFEYNWRQKGGMFAGVVSGAEERAVVGGILELSNKKLLSWSTDEAAIILDRTSADLAVPLNGHADYLTGALELIDGRILTWSIDNTLRIWTSDGTCRVQLVGHTGAVIGAAELSDGMILSWSADKTLRIWDASSGRPMGKLEGHGDWGLEAIELTGGKILFWSSPCPDLHIWDTISGGTSKFEGHCAWVRGAIELEDERILSWSQDEILIWDPSRPGLPPLVWQGHRALSPKHRSNASFPFPIWLGDEIAAIDVFLGTSR